MDKWTPAQIGKEYTLPPILEPLGDGNMHLYKDLPVLLAGGGAGIQGGRHLKFPQDTPMANLYVTLLEKLGVFCREFRR